MGLVDGGMGSMKEGNREVGLGEIDDRTRAVLDGVLSASLVEQHSLPPPVEGDTHTSQSRRYAENIRMTNSSTNMTTSSSSSNTTRTSSKISSPARCVPISQELPPEQHSRKKPTIGGENILQGVDNKQGVDYEGVVSRLQHCRSTGMLTSGMLPFSALSTSAPTTSSSSSSPSSSHPPSPPLASIHTQPPSVSSVIVNAVHGSGNGSGNGPAITTTDVAGSEWRISNHHPSDHSDSRDGTDGNHLRTL